MKTRRRLAFNASVRDNLVVAPLGDDLATPFIAGIQCHGAIGAYILPCAVLKLCVGLCVKRQMVVIFLADRELGGLPFRETE